jgi:hypothetical protein
LKKIGYYIYYSFVCSVENTNNTNNVLIYSMICYFIIKEINKVFHELLFEVVYILHKYNVGGITFFDINGTAKRKHEPIQEQVCEYMIWRTIVRICGRNKG